jgi:myosin-3
LLVPGGRKVAIKIQAVTADTEEDLRTEYHILREFSSHPNLPDLYGIDLSKASSDSECDRIWFVMEV